MRSSSGASGSVNTSDVSFGLEDRRAVRIGELAALGMIEARTVFRSVGDEAMTRRRWWQSAPPAPR